MKNKELILSGISLIVAFFSLTLSTYAWIVRGATANVKGVNVAVSSIKLKRAELIKYKAITIIDDQEVIIYNKGERIYNTTSLNPYDPIFGYDKIIYEFNVEANENVNVNLLLYLKNDKYGNNESNKVFYENGYCYNYLSNVATFAYINDQTKMIEGETIILDYNTYFTNKIIMREINLKQGINTISFLFDYNEDNINRLCTDNIGLNHNRIAFKNDIEFSVNGVEE